MATAASGDTTPPVPSQVPRAWILALLAHLGLLVMCASTVYTLQPADFSKRRWLALGLLALATLIYGAVTRGRCALGATGKSLTAFLALAALSLTYDPQLADWGSLGEKMPSWLGDAAPSLGTLGWLWAVAWGGVYLAVVRPAPARRAPLPYPRAVLVTAALVLALGLGSFLALRQVYEIDALYMVMLSSQVVQYASLALVMLGLAGRSGVGAAPQLYLALAILAALARNFMAGGESA